MQDTDPETDKGSTGGRPCHNGSGMVKTLVPMRGTPGVRGRHDPGRAAGSGGSFTSE
ncbi:hypothetical protein T261_3735 [Streptomyces lydicus]|nr:hypothetical protein T261_3735 [Streptomyces lydicus]